MLCGHLPKAVYRSLQSTKAMGKILVSPMDNNIDDLLNVHPPLLKK